MNSNMLITFILIFIVIYLGDLFIVIRPKVLKITGKKEVKKTKKKKKENSLGELEYLSNKFKLDRNKIDYKEFMYIVPLINSFIITLVTLIIDLIPLPFIIKLIIGFILLVGLIYSLYEIYGRHLLKKEREN